MIATAAYTRGIMEAFKPLPGGTYMGVMLKVPSKGHQRENCRNCGAPPQGPVCPYCKTHH